MQYLLKDSENICSDIISIVNIIKTNNSPKPIKNIYMQQNPTPQIIPTIKQVYRQLKQSYTDIEQLFSQIGVAPLSTSEDLQNKKITIDQVISKIPTEERLESMINSGKIKGLMKSKVMGYTGPIELIQTAKQNFSDLKKQQQKIYYIAVQSQLNTVSPEFKQIVPVQNLKILNSYTKVAEVKKNKLKVLEKNSLSDQYLKFQDGKAQLDNKNEPVVKCARKTLELKKYDLLVHVNYYDSCNMEKQYQFVCLEEQMLSAIVDKFKCVVDTLRNIQKLRKKQPPGQKQPPQIYDKLYQAPPQRNLSKPHPPRPEQPYSPPPLKYLIVQDIIFYQGNKIDLEPLIQECYNKTKIRYRCFEMSKAKICDMRVVFGRPYLYRHLGGCDHMVVFKEARLFMGNDQYNNDILQLEKYPITIYESRMKRKKCQGCSLYFADIVTVGDPLKNGQNLYLCMNCHHDLHFDENGQTKKEELVKVVNYIHD